MIPKTIRLSWLLAAAVSCCAAQGITISSPKAGETLKGTVTLSASAGGLPSLAALEFSIGAKSLGVIHGPPYGIRWNTAYACDGMVVVQATARNALGKTIATAEQPFAIDNHGNSISVVSPDLSQPLSGTVTLKTSATDAAHYPAIWIFNVDGENRGTVWTDHEGRHTTTVANAIDTTALPNGTHELYIGVHSNYFPAGDLSRMSWHNWTAACHRTITTNNGHALMEIVANYLHVYLLPGESTQLGCSQRYTDHLSSPCTGATYSSSDPAVAKAGGGGMLAALAPGFATVTIRAHGKTTEAYVWVRAANKNAPHFAGNGRMLNVYEPGNSTFPIAPFVLMPGELRAHPTIRLETRRAGINTLYLGFYPNPRDRSMPFDVWQRHYEAEMGSQIQWARNNGFQMLCMGDDGFRNIGGEAWWTLNWPYAKQAVQYAMRQLANSGVGIAVDVVDEASSIWGATPTPPRFIGSPGALQSVACNGRTCTITWPGHPLRNGAQFALAGSKNPGLNTPGGTLYTAGNATPNSFEFTPARPVSGTFTPANDGALEYLWWAGPYCNGRPCNPPVPNDAVQTFSEWMKSAGLRVPISWPGLGAAPNAVHSAWMGKQGINAGISDYASHYWTSLTIRPAYTWSSGIQEMTGNMRQAYYGRQPAMNLDRPQLLLASVASFAYRKQTPGASFYMPPADLLDVPGVTPAVVSAQMMTAAALGASGIRLYGYEPVREINTRAEQPVGTYFQTGASPQASDPVVSGNWRAMGYAANLLTKVLEPYLLSTALNSPAYGRNIVSAARQGPDAKLLLVVNGNDWQRTIDTDFAPFRTGRPITRYRLTATGIETYVLPDEKGEILMLQPGESVAYLFPFSGTRFTVPVKITFTGQHRVALDYSYIYAPGIVRTKATECDPSCTLYLDRRLGEVYYWYKQLDPTGVAAPPGIGLVGSSNEITVPFPAQ